MVEQSIINYSLSIFSFKASHLTDFPYRNISKSTLLQQKDINSLHMKKKSTNFSK